MKIKEGIDGIKQRTKLVVRPKRPDLAQLFNPTHFHDKKRGGGRKGHVIFVKCI